LKYCIPICCYRLASLRVLMYIYILGSFRNVEKQIIERNYRIYHSAKYYQLLLLKWSRKFVNIISTKPKNELKKYQNNFNLGARVVKYSTVVMIAILTLYNCWITHNLWLAQQSHFGSTVIISKIKTEKHQTNLNRNCSN